MTEGVYVSWDANGQPVITKESYGRDSRWFANIELAEDAIAEWAFAQWAKEEWERAERLTQEEK